ncbi:MAG: hypothetical protein JJT94_01740, partial [Bernardetiaceae bacterium]|nr:hypothetical protein [Bernardetiaceae bacterium]
SQYMQCIVKLQIYFGGRDESLGFFGGFLLFTKEFLRQRHKPQQIETHGNNQKLHPNGNFNPIYISNFYIFTTYQIYCYFMVGSNINLRVPRERYIL